ncbi:glycerol dehydrogenase [Christensenella tenuis]|jgi:glycerol dehydrogenase|uniref:Glycerol dehydrogenase n=1 Tax=Christensenella tenuis TaxID=2763033 RepID=A0ABR7EHF3_9FIRM|nr:glycerol dehydrogenase [Christensenella tenuis]MBC5649210.1 glycerol dehydrogenase [Christensenella tenuis]
MARLTKTTRGWCSPERYVQGPGEFKNIKHYTDKFGKRIVAFIDQFFFEDFTKQLQTYYSGNGYELHTIEFNSEVTEEEIARHAEELKDWNAEVVLGIGGGKTIDVANAVAVPLGIPNIVIPTTAATDAPTSSLSVIYHADGSHKGEFFFDHSPCLVLVDSEIIAKAPVRFLVSGMGDALATLIEAEANRKSDSPNLVYNNDGGFKRTVAATAIARACYDTLLRDGLKAKIACEENKVTEALENIIETNTLLSGLGFENNATAGAHSVNDGITSLPEGAKTYHGEKVAFGTLTQLVIEDASNERLDEVIRFCIDVGLPVCLADLQVPNTAENIRKIAEASMHSCWGSMPFEVNADMVEAAITTADKIGERYKKQYKNALLV